MERQKDRADQNAERAGQRRVAERQAKARANKTDRDGEEMKIAQEPERALIPAAPMTLAFRHVVDRALVDAADPLRARLACHQLLEAKGRMYLGWRQSITMSSNG